MDVRKCGWASKGSEGRWRASEEISRGRKGEGQHSVPDTAAWQGSWHGWKGRRRCSISVGADS